MSWSEPGTLYRAPVSMREGVVCVSVLPPSTFSFVEIIFIKSFQSFVQTHSFISLSLSPSLSLSASDWHLNSPHGDVLLFTPRPIRLLSFLLSLSPFSHGKPLLGLLMGVMGAAFILLSIHLFIRSYWLNSEF